MENERTFTQADYQSYDLLQLDGFILRERFHQLLKLTFDVLPDFCWLIVPCRLVSSQEHTGQVI